MELYLIWLSQYWRQLSIYMLHYLQMTALEPPSL